MFCKSLFKLMNTSSGIDFSKQEEKFSIRRCTKCKKRYFGAGDICPSCKTGKKVKWNLSNTMGAINKK